MYKERNCKGGANPEVKAAVEDMASEVTEATLGYIDRNLLMEIKN